MSRLVSSKRITRAIKITDDLRKNLERLGAQIAYQSGYLTVTPKALPQKFQKNFRAFAVSNQKTFRLLAAAIKSMHESAPLLARCITILNKYPMKDRDV